MSTLRTYNIQNPDSASVNIELTSDGGAVASGILTATTLNATTISGVSTIGVTTATVTTLTVNGNAYPSAGPLSNRNLIINGAMQVAQRGTSFTGVTNTQFTVDRFAFHTTDEATYTLEQSSESPAGFEKSLKVTVTTADSSIEADDYTAFQYVVEGYDAIPLAFGTADAKYVTLSFWVRSSETGNFGLHVHNVDNNRDWDASYTVNSANTWEHKTITIPGDTAGTWLKNNGVGLKLWFSLLVGSTYEASAVSTSWGSTLALGVNGQVQLSSVLNATWQITGVQLEVGETATPFEHRSYGDDMAKCQRYLQLVNYNSGGGYAVNHWGFRDTVYYIFRIFHKVDMRANPNLVAIGSYGLTGLSNSEHGLYNLNAATAVTVSGTSGAWDITQQTTGVSTLRFTGTSLQGTTGDIAGSDTMILNTSLFLDAEL